MWGMHLSISRDHVEKLFAWAEEAFPKECCGLVLGHGDQVTQLELATNVATNPDTHFEIDPVALIKWEKASRSGDFDLLGYFHSHPNGLKQPSKADAEQASKDGRFWLIIADSAVTGWQCLSDGELHDSFSSVLLNIIGDSQA